MLLLYIFLLVLMFSSVPYAVLLVKRGRIAAELRTSLERVGADFKGRGIWYMGGIDGRRADFFVLFDGRVIAVKVIGFLSSGTAVHFESMNSYLIKKLRPQETDAPLSTYKRHKKKPYDFTTGIPEEWRGLPTARVILIMEPRPEKLTRPTASGDTLLRIGDSTGEGELYDVRAFSALFKK